MRNHTLALLILGLALTAEVSAQTITPKVIASAGSHHATANGQLSWTIGESVIRSLSADQHIITQGFHQTHTQHSDTLSIGELSGSGHGVSVYPNPASDRAIIEIDGPYDRITAHLFDLQGRLVRSEDLTGDSGRFELDLRQIAASTYILNVRTRDGQVSSHRIIKSFN